MVFFPFPLGSVRRRPLGRLLLVLLWFDSNCKPRSHQEEGRLREKHDAIGDAGIVDQMAAEITCCRTD
jgi:hypothetical protein